MGEVVVKKRANFGGKTEMRGTGREVGELKKREKRDLCAGEDGRRGSGWGGGGVEVDWNKRRKTSFCAGEDVGRGEGLDLNKKRKERPEL